MDHLEQRVIVHPSASFLREGIMLILGSHGLLRVDAIQVLKVRTVVLDHLTEDLCLDLLQKFLESIAVYEEALSRGMCMQVQKEIHSIKGLEVSLDTPDGLAE